MFPLSKKVVSLPIAFLFVGSINQRKPSLAPWKRLLATSVLAGIKTMTKSFSSRQQLAAQPKAKAQQMATPPPPRLSSVHVVFACDCPLHINDKWGERSGHETQDTQLIGVFAQLANANRCAKEEAGQCNDEDRDQESEGDDDDDDGDLFCWQEDDPCEWTARRVWAEAQSISQV